jgi:HEAT repeat protein
MTQLVHGGQTRLTWTRLLRHDLLHIRLCALRVLSGLGEAGARALLMGPSFRRQGECYPFIWALTRCVQPGLFQALRVSGEASHDLLARARYLTRRAARPHSYRRRLSRAACAEAIAHSDHPLETLACTVRLLEIHKDDAVPVLLELLRTPPPQLIWDEKAECAAWALGQLGRLAMHDVIQEYRKASKRVASHLAMALWYLGPLAEKAIPYLIKDSSPEATAALLAMEDKASLAMVEARRGPVWLDELAVQALAEIAFSDGDRSYAAAGLGCFGPAAPTGLPILRHLSQDPDLEVRLNVARGLGWGGRPDGMSLLLELGEDPDGSVRQRASQSIKNYYESPDELRQVLLVSARSGSEMERRRAAEQLGELGLAEGTEVGDLLADSFTAGPILKAMLAWNHVAELYRPRVLELTQQKYPMRLAAARLLERWPDDEESRKAWRRLLWEGALELQELAVAAVQRSGLGLSEWQLGAAELLSLPGSVLGQLLAAVPQEKLCHQDLLPLLERPEPEARLAAAIALGICARLEEVEEALAAQLHLQDDRLAVQCARTLLKLGSQKYRWAFLRSAHILDREEALGSGGLPESFREEYVSGLLYSESNFKLMCTMLPVEQAAEIEAEAMAKLRAKARPSQLGSLGPVALPYLPELLGHYSPSVRLAARDALKALFSIPSHACTDWLAFHGLQLPLVEGASPAELEALQVIVCNYLQRSNVCSDERIRPLWQLLSRSWVAQVACLAVDSLGRAYRQTPAPELMESLLVALHHAEESVRRSALLRVGRDLDPRGWTPPFRKRISPEAWLVTTAKRFAEQPVDVPASELQQALEFLNEVRGLDTSFFVPELPVQLMILLNLAGRSPGYDFSLAHLIWTYRGETEKTLWDKILQVAQDPLLTHLHGALVERWPQLVVSALRERPDGVEWVGSLGKRCLTGMFQALRHKKAELRLKALAVLPLLEEGFSSYHSQLRQLADSDPDPEVKAAAQALFT